MLKLFVVVVVVVRFAVVVLVTLRFSEVAMKWIRVQIKTEHTMIVIVRNQVNGKNVCQSE